MTAPFRNVAIFAKPRTEGNRPALQQVLLHIVRLVEEAGLTAMIEAATQKSVDLRGFEGHPLSTLAQQADVAIVLGGDGTMLGIARELSAYGTPLIGINFGRLGFVTDIGLDEMPDVLSEMLAGRYEVDHRRMLEAEVLRDGIGMYRGRAFNDVVVSHGTAGGHELPILVGILRRDVVCNCPGGESFLLEDQHGPHRHDVRVIGRRRRQRVFRLQLFFKRGFRPLGLRQRKRRNECRGKRL